MHYVKLYVIMIICMYYVKLCTHKTVAFLTLKRQHTRTCPPARVRAGGHKDFDLKPKPEVSILNPLTKSMNLIAISTSTVLKTT